MPAVCSSVHRPNLTYPELEINVVIAESAKDTAGDSEKEEGSSSSLWLRYVSPWTSSRGNVAGRQTNEEHEDMYSGWEKYRHTVLCITSRVN